MRLIHVRDQREIAARDRSARSQREMQRDRTHARTGGEGGTVGDKVLALGVLQGGEEGVDGLGRRRRCSVEITTRFRARFSAITCMRARAAMTARSAIKLALGVRQGGEEGVGGLGSE